jgi:molybdenum cofactor guanylyltransferase
VSGHITASAIILAGGRSLRMGTSKAALDFGGVPILRRIVDELRRRLLEVIVVSAPDASPGPAIEVHDARVIHDDLAFAGPLDALRRGLLAASHEIAFACSCDLPLLNADLATAICTMVGNREAAIPKVDGRDQPLCAAYRTSVAASIARMVGDGEKRMLALIDTLDTRRVNESELRPFDPDLRSFINVNTPEDYARALKLIGAADAG